MNVYKNLTANNKFPFVVLNLEIPPHDVVVNGTTLELLFEISKYVRLVLLVKSNATR